MLHASETVSPTTSVVAEDRGRSWEDPTMRARDLVMRSVARFAVAGWFASVEMSGMERAPGRGPMLVVASHEGGFVDPVLLAATLPRFPRFLAMASLWRTPARPFLALAGAIPVSRASDGPTTSNVSAFRESHEVLAGGDVVAIFPEGRASDEVQLLPMRTGAARIALGARASGAEGLRIVPIGLIYENKARARARVYVRVGTPIELDADLELLAPPGHRPSEEDRGTVDALTEEIGERLSAASLDFESAAQMSSFALAATIALRPLDADPGWRPVFSAREDLTTFLGDAPADQQQRVREASDAYRAAMEANAITDAAVAADPTRHRRVHVAGLAAAVVLAVPALVGVVVNTLPAVLTWLSGRRRMAPVTRATVKFLVALATFPLTWLAWRYLPPIRDSDHPWWTTALIGPVCGLAAAWMGARVRRAARARVNVRRLAGVGASLHDLRARREHVVEAVAAVTAESRFGQAGVPAGNLGD
jgi:glycerol-3-phosphate O-acyltransferase / dihydroxyacetone phosphate acyltransferase